MKKIKHIVSGIFVIFVFSFAILLVFMPKQEFSQNEKKVLSAFPRFSTEALFDGTWFKNIENYVSDHFPFREAFVGINSYFNMITGRNGTNGVYKCSDGYLIAAPNQLDVDRMNTNIRRASGFTEKLGLPTTVMLVPSAGYVLEEKMPENHLPYNDEVIFNEVMTKLTNVDFVDLRVPFTEETKKGNQLYFKTDHHLDTNGSYVMYKEFCEAKGLSFVDGFEEKEKLEDFYGTNYSKSGLWLEKPDTVEIWHSANNYDYDVLIDDITQQESSDSLYFYKHDENMDKYPVFLDGNHALVTIKNNSVQNGKKLLIVKDSYAHCFATFLCENYEEICLVDLRYYIKSISQLAQTQGSTEVLFLFGAENFASIQNFAFLK